ncbi:MAG: sensor domain-containing diguanylate cyclase [Gammaproteobacteria bacterium]|jgi:diguanylate cyclase (GGDEF)-like protein/PAS domain S-box-containing protein
MSGKTGHLTISTLTGTFLDSRLEDKFCGEIWPQLAERIAAVGIVGGLIFAIAGISDYQSVGLTPAFWFLLVLRLGGLGMGLWLVSLTRAADYNGPRVRLALLLFEIYIATGFLIIVAVQGGSVDFHTLSTIVIVISYYVFLPNLSLAQLLVPLVLTLSFCVLAATSLEAGLRGMTIPVLLLILINILGLMFARFLNRSQRVEREGLHRMSRLNQRLKKEIEEREFAEQLSRASQENLQRLFDVAPIPMVLTRLSDGAILRANTAAGALLDIDPAVIRRAHTVDFYMDPADRPRLLAQLQKQEHLEDVELALKHRDGHEVMVLFSAAIVNYHDEKAVLASLVDITARKAMEEELTRLANTDPLTESHNRRYFFEAAAREVWRARRSGRSLCVLLIDIDLFKRVNDRFGHAVGDEVLQKVVDLIRSQLRQYDVMARLGGEEFAILVPETGAVEALDVAERIRYHVQESPVQTSSGTLDMTVSIGLAEVDLRAASMDLALNHADTAMYQAKALGRNRVEQYAAR